MELGEKIKLETGKEYTLGTLKKNVSAKYLGKGIFAVAGKEKKYIITGGEGLIRESNGVLIPDFHSSFLHELSSLEELSESYLEILRELGEEI